jgi:hypothetical protein
MMPQTRLVPSFHDVDFSDLQLPMVCIFKHPDDFPEHYVARIFAAVDGKPVPTDMAMISPAIQGLYDGMPFGSGRFTMRFPRKAGEHPTVVETWI